MPTLKLLAFDTSTEVMSIAVTDGVQVWQHNGPGAAQASQHLIPTILELLKQAGLQLAQLDALVFGRGPGSFTGLRTACAVAQGLAAGAGLPVLPIDTLLAVAEQARFDFCQAHPQTQDLHITALLDARMGEMYAQSYEFSSGQSNQAKPCSPVKPENWPAYAASSQPRTPGLTWLLAGNVFDVYPLPELPGTVQLHALPTASALLRLAPALIAAGLCVAPEQAQPLYVRDKVALTTEERALQTTKACRGGF